MCIFVVCLLSLCVWFFCLYGFCLGLYLKNKNELEAFLLSEQICSAFIRQHEPAIFCEPLFLFGDGSFCLLYSCLVSANTARIQFLKQIWVNSP